MAQPQGLARTQSGSCSLRPSPDSAARWLPGPTGLTSRIALLTTRTALRWSVAEPRAGGIDRSRVVGFGSSAERRGTWSKPATHASTALEAVSASPEQPAAAVVDATSVEATVTPSPPSVELDRLADLHARGVLTDDEFTQAKARALRE